MTWCPQIQWRTRRQNKPSVDAPIWDFVAISCYSCYVLLRLLLQLQILSAEKCRFCAGSGSVTVDLGGEAKEVSQCINCDGAGSLTCTTCQGSGIQPRYLDRRWVYIKLKRSYRLISTNYGILDTNNLVLLPLSETENLRMMTEYWVHSWGNWHIFYFIFGG